MTDLKQLDKIEINFIIGPGRSGTTLLTTILNQHENCVCGLEIRHLIYFKRKYSTISIITEEVLTELDNYLSIYFYSKTFPIFNKYDKSLLNPLKVGMPCNFQQIVKFIYLIVYKNKENGIRVIVDKNPWYTFYIEELIELFPKAKFIALTRDYHAYVNSIAQSRPSYVKKKPLAYYAHTWNLFTDELNKWRPILKDRILFLKYEEFVIDKEKNIHLIQSFLNLPIQMDILNFYKTQPLDLSLSKSDLLQHERLNKKLNDLSKPVNVDNIKAWKSKLTSKEVLLIESICANRGSSIDYFHENKSIPLLIKLKNKLLGFPYFIRVKLFKWIKSPRINYWQIKQTYRAKLKLTSKHER